MQINVLTVPSGECLPISKATFGHDVCMWTIGFLTARLFINLLPEAIAKIDGFTSG